MSFFFPQLPFKEMSILCHQLAVTEKAGVTMKRTFELLHESAASKDLRCAAGNIVTCIEEGATFGQATHWERKCFPEFFVEMVGIGERTGTLDRVFSQLEDYYDSLWKIRQKVLRAMTYFLILLLLVCVVFPVVSYLASVFLHPGHDNIVLGLFTILLRGTYPFVVLMIFFALIQRSPRLKGVFNLIAWYLWPFSIWSRSFALSRFYETLHLFHFTDISTQRALSAAGQATGNPLLKRAFDAAAAEVREGQPLSESLARVPDFPKGDLELLSVSETSGSLPKTFKVLSRDHYQSALFRTRNFAVVFAFIMIYVMTMPGAWALAQQMISIFRQRYDSIL